MERPDGEDGNGAGPNRKVPFSPRPFRPAWWLPGPHGQTIGGRLLRPAGGVVYRRERVPTLDGDFLDLDHPRPPSGATRDASALVLLLHGLGGCSESRYILETCRRLAEAGLAGLALNFRSCGGEPNRNRRFYHSGDTDDLDLVLRLLRNRHPEKRIGVIGYSLGGNVLLKYLGERGAAARGRVDAAAAASVPFDLAAGGRELERGVGRVYGHVFLRSLRRSVRTKAALHAHDYDLESLSAARTLRQFDDAVTAPVHGFRDAADYYRRSRSDRFLPGIRVPTLLLHSADDPFLPDRAIPRAAARENPWLVPAFTRRGGHLGFVAGTHPGRPRFWAEAEAVRFMDRILMSGTNAGARTRGIPAPERGRNGARRV